LIIVLNAYPGVGKLTIGQELVAQINGRLLDIHSVYNIPFALTEFKSPEFIEATEKIEAIAHGLVLKLPNDVPVVLTTVLAGSSDWGDAEWQRIVKLGRERPPLLVVHLHCDLEENIRRIQSAGRAAKRKPRDPEMARRNHEQRKVLAGINEANLLQLDVTSLSPADAAERIAIWAKGD
jgi:hypothetical protein